MPDPTPDRLSHLEFIRNTNAKSIALAFEVRDARIAELEGRHHQIPNTDFFDWLADRLVEVYGESPNTDFVLSLRKRAEEAAFVKEGWPDE